MKNNVDPIMERIGVIIEKLGNPSELMEMFNLCNEMRKIIVIISNKIVPILNEEFLKSDSSAEKIKEVCLFYEKELPELDNMSIKASEIVKSNKEKNSKKTAEVNSTYESIFSLLNSILKDSIQQVEVFGISYRTITEYAKTKQTNEDKNNDFIQMTLEKPDTTTKVE